MPSDFVPFREALALSVTLSTQADALRGDPTNFLGGIADVLQRKPDIESLGDLASVLVYENDLQLRRIDFRHEANADVGYELRITSLGGPDLVERRLGPLPGLEISIELFEVDELALNFVNLIQRLGRRTIDIADPAGLMSWMQMQRVASDPVLATARSRFVENAVEAQAWFAQATDLSAALSRLFLNERQPNDLTLITDLRRVSARYERVDLETDMDLPLANLELDGQEPISLLAPIVRSALRLLLPSVRGRVRVCSDQTCRKLFLDRSKNGTRIWCSMQTCGSRAKVRTWRLRHAKLEESAVTYVVT